MNQTRVVVNNEPDDELGNCGDDHRYNNERTRSTVTDGKSSKPLTATNETVTELEAGGHSDQEKYEHVITNFLFGFTATPQPVDNS